MNEITQVLIVHGRTQKTDCPIIYTGNFLLITNKNVEEVDGKTIMTSTTTPVNLNDVIKITTVSEQKQYKKYAEI